MASSVKAAHLPRGGSGGWGGGCGRVALAIFMWPPVLDLVVQAYFVLHCIV